VFDDLDCRQALCCVPYQLRFGEMRIPNTELSYKAKGRMRWVIVGCCSMVSYRRLTSSVLTEPVLSPKLLDDGMHKGGNNNYPECKVSVKKGEVYSFYEFYDYY
jgi:hypothetical protein